MAVIKCKMCGGELNITEGESVAECEYCGSKQTLPNQDSEKKLTLFARADRLRRAGEFDKAAGVYENIVADFPEEAEAYWGLVLCRYGIEYVDDPATGKKVPTCHRSSFNSILEDSDFDQACENADPIARRLYRDEAKAIEDIRKGILEVSGKEEPYDIFICYKETDENGSRTIDSVIAQDVYDALTEKGYRVFFSRISLEDKLGTEYEPYIFAALNSAKVMLVFGTDFEYFNAVWVKNEWSRFLKLMTQDKSKHLIPCYKNIDAYDMPKEFAKLQAQDLGKVGAIQDLLRGIGKILDRGVKTETTPTPIVSVASTAPGVEALLKRGNMALEDGEWDRANEFFEQVLNMDAECAEAYLGLAMARFKCSTRDRFANTYIMMKPDAGNKNLLRARQFGGGAIKNWLDEIEHKRLEVVKRREEEEEAKRQRQAAYEEAERQRQAAYEEAERQRQEASKIAFREKMKPLWKSIREMSLLCSSFHTVGLKSDGTVVATGLNDHGQCDVGGWSDIVAIATGVDHTVGLKFDGTLVTVGCNVYNTRYAGQCDVSGWTDIITIAAGNSHTVGLKFDGTVVAVGDNYYGQCDVDGWSDIVAIAAGCHHTVGLKSNGTVVATGDNSNNGQCNVSGWSDIVAIAAGGYHTVGLRTDGTVVATGDNDNGQCNVTDWSNVVAITAEDWHTVGLKSDGSVVAVGDKIEGQCDVSDWSDIVAISTGCWHTVGLKFDGTVIAAGRNDCGQCDVKDWRLFNDIEVMVRELSERKAKAEIKHHDALEQEKQTLQAELPTLKGLFSGKRRREIEARLAEIKRELDVL